MRKSIITICLLFVSLVSVWTYKINNPVNEPQALAIETDKSWWEDESSIPIAIAALYVFFIIRFE